VAGADPEGTGNGAIAAPPPCDRIICRIVLWRRCHFTTNISTSNSVTLRKHWNPYLAWGALDAILQTPLVGWRMSSAFITPRRLGSAPRAFPPRRQPCLLDPPLVDTTTTHG